MNQMEYKEVEKYLENYSLTEPPYDANGAIHLLKAIVENLQGNFTESDLEDYAFILNKENEEFLEKLVEKIPISRRKTRF